MGYISKIKTPNNTTYDIKDAKLTEEVNQNKNNISSLYKVGSANILKNTAQTQTVGGVTFTINADGTITANGTKTNNDWLYLSTGNSLKQGAYVLSSGGIIGDDKLVIVTTDDTLGTAIMTTDTATGVFERNLTQNYSNLRYAIRIARGTVCNNVTFKPMLCEKSVYEAINGEFQPYAMSNAELTAKEQVNENNISYLANNSVKNIFHRDAGIYNHSNIKFTTNADGSISLSGTANGDAVLTFSNTLDTTDDTYILYGDGFISGVFMDTYETGYTNRRTFTSSVVTNSNTKIWRLIVNSGTNVNGVTIRPMLCKKSLFDADRSYQPYAMSNAELTAKEQTNENNILLNARNGVSNYINTPDVTISASGYVLNKLGCNIPKGDYYLKYTSTQTISGNIQITLKDSNNTTVYDTTTTSTSGGNLIPITLSTEAKTITIYSVRAGTYSNLQIISKSLYDAGLTDYQPYAMSNAEITAWILAHS